MIASVCSGTNLDEVNYYNLRSRKVIIKNDLPRKNNRRSKKTSASKLIEKNYPDSGFSESLDLITDKPATTIPESPINKNFNWRKALNLVEKKRDTGLYIECCNLNCHKFRYCEKYHDPVDVPELWFCHDLGGGITCATPEEAVPPVIMDDLIENIYTAGSLVWARYPRYPWWPAMVCDSPDTLSYYILKPSSPVPIKYHIVYFSNVGKVERSWLTLRNLKPFAKTPRNSLNKRMIYKNIDYTEEVNGAYEIALAILKNGLTISERLAGYSFLSLFGGYSPSMIGSMKSFRSAMSVPYILNQSVSPEHVSSNEDFIPGTPQKKLKFTLYLETSKCKKKKLFNK